MGLLSFLFMVYDSGSIFSPEVLDLTQDELIHNFFVVPTWSLHCISILQFLISILYDSYNFHCHERT